MRLLSRIVAIATVPAWIGMHVDPAAAQTFNERWSVIPKAHAEPAPESPGDTKQNPQMQTPTRAERTPTQAPIAALSHSVCQPSFFRKGLILFISDREDSKRLLVRSEFANRGPPQPAVRHEGSRH